MELVRVRRDLNRTTLEVRRLLANSSVSMAPNWMALSKGCCNVGFSVVGFSKSMSSRSRQTMRGAALRGAAEERAVVLGAIEGKAKLSSSAERRRLCVRFLSTSALAQRKRVIVEITENGPEGNYAASRHPDSPNRTKDANETNE